MKRLVQFLLFLALSACGSTGSDAQGYGPTYGPGSGGGGGTGRPSYNTGVGFYVVNDQGNYTCSSTHPCKLYDHAGVAFRVHGTNSVHYDDGANAQVYLSGATAMRMNVSEGCATVTTCSTDIMQSWAINHNIVPIPARGWGSTTCDTTTTTLNSAVTGWTSNASTYKPDEKYMIVNIANEWGPGDTNDSNFGNPGTDTNGTAWASAYETAITNMRNAGYLGTLLIDAGGCGKSASDIIDQGQNLLSYDPQHNLVFALHEYDFTAKETQAGSTPPQANILAAIGATGLPYIIGEFGHNGDATGATTTIANDMANCEAAANCLGWLGWAWDDDPGTYGYLTPTNTTTFDGTTATLSTWGQQIVFDVTNGLCSTASPCSGTARWPRATFP